MISLSDYTDPFVAILDFEKALAEFTGAPYVITTDCCTHAIEIAFRIEPVSHVKFMAKTYLSVPMVMHKLGISYELMDRPWWGEYQFEGSRVWDSARRMEPGMYRAGQIQCLSFGLSKPLFIGRGGCILTDDPEIYRRASRMRSDGRDLFAYKLWKDQQEFEVGYHYTLRPEECVKGLNLLNARQFTEQTPKMHDYPDCREIVIRDSALSNNK